MGKADGELVDSQTEASKVLEAALQQMDGFISGVKLEPGDIPPLPSSLRPVSEIAEELSRAISESSCPPSLPNSKVALILQHWINQNCNRAFGIESGIMLEAKKSGKIAITSFDKDVKNSFKVKNLDLYSRSSNRPNKVNLNIENSENSDVQEKESETDSEKEHGYELEEINDSSLTIVNEEKETGSEISNKKLSVLGNDDSSLDESTVKQIWSSSITPEILSSVSSFSSSEDEDEDEDPHKKKRTGDEKNYGKNNKRNSITKDCNSDFHWVISENQPESKSSFEIKKPGKNGVQNLNISLKYFEDTANKVPASNPFYSLDRDRKTLDCTSIDLIKSEPPVQLRLPPQSPGSLDRKRLLKSRLERNQKSKSSIITRNSQTARISVPKTLGEEISLAFPDSKKTDFSCSQEDRQQYFSDENKYYRCFRNSYGGHSHCGDSFCCHQAYHQVFQPPACRSFYGSCESLPERTSWRTSFDGQKVFQEGRSSRKSVRENEPRFHESNEYVPDYCQCDRKKSNSWWLLGKSGSELEERIIRLENDKESLQLQVSVLTEQVEAQNEKIMDLQQSLEEKKQQLANTEDLLQREILTRSSLETQKLELMSTISEIKLQQAAMERGNYELKEEKKRYQNVKPPMIPRNTSPALLQSTPIPSRYSPNDYSASRKSGNLFSNQDLYQSDSSAAQLNSFSDSHKCLTNSAPNNKVLSSSSFGVNQHYKDNIKYSSSPQPNVRRPMDQYNSLPRQKIFENQEMNQNTELPGRGIVFGKGLTSLITLKSEKSYSAPNLAETEKSGRDEKDNLNLEVESPKPTETNQNQGTARKGIKKIFNKIKRSNSGNVNDLLGDGEFKRGGYRATAGPRLGGRIVQVYIPVDKPFAEWDTETLCGWLEDLGLENYVADMRRWVKSGSHLLAASPCELEKELGMKNHLHKKKLMLALQEMNEKNAEADEFLKAAGCLDTAWVMRWLDDVGLPQHKEVFLSARVDGRMLHRLTMDDLATMHITSALHVASLKKGIKVLREHKMDPNCLTRRSVPEEPPPTAADVALWTNHRVMEWLRIVDLAEYAPNLRGSGVHGALMVYETKFTAELLASLLNIPPNKTLLRRHLNTHFKELLGRDVIQAKREAETTLGYIPLTPSSKVKMAKKPQFTLKRKKNKNDIDFGDLVCPMDDEASGENSTVTNTCLSTNDGDGTMKERRHVQDVCLPIDLSPRNSPLTTRLMHI